MLPFRSLHPLLIGLLAGTLVASPGWAAIREAYDPADPEDLVSLQTEAAHGGEVAWHAEFWVSRPEMVLVSVSSTTPGVTWPKSGLQSPPLSVDGAALPPRHCHASEPSRFQVPMTVDEFRKLVHAKAVDVRPVERSFRLTAEQRTSLREFWERLHPLIQDPAFRAHALLREGSAEAIATLLRGGWNANRPTYVGRPPLVVVAAQGNLDGVNVLLRAGAKLDLADQQGRTALHHAIQQGHTELAIELLDRGASLLRPDASGSTPLHVAVSARNVLMVQALLERGAPVDAADSRGMTPLHRSVEASALSEATPAGGFDPAVMQTSRRAEPEELAATLLRFGADPRKSVKPDGVSLGEEDGLNALELCLRRDDEAMMTVLRASPLIRAEDVPDLRNDLTEPLAYEALARLQSRIRLLSPGRLWSEYASRRLRDAEGLDGTDGSDVRGDFARRSLQALDPRFAVMEPPSEAMAPDAAMPKGPESATVVMTRPAAVEGQEKAAFRLRLVREDGVWRIDRLDAH